MKEHFTKWQLGLAALLMVAMANSPAGAHHSVAMFDLSKQVVLTGTVEKWIWANPHSWLYARVKNKAGAQEVWGFELGGPNMLIRNGWNAADIKEGDKVTVTAAPSRDGTHIGLLKLVQLPDKRVLSSGFGSSFKPPAGPPPKGLPPPGGPGAPPHS